MNIAYSLKWFICQIYFENFSSYISFNSRSKNIIILANGPSLKQELSSKTINFQESEIFVLNDFARFSIFKEIKPRYYILADPFYFSNFDNVRNVGIQGAFNSIDWEMTLFIPFRDAKKIKPRISNSNINLVFYHSEPYDGWKLIRHFLYKNNLSMPRIQNVLIPAIFISINMGFKKISLYGVDHSWTEELRVNSKNEVCFLYEHFFDNKKPELKPWHKGVGLPIYRMHEILRDLAWMFDGYHNLREYADIRGCRVVNKTSHSYIDAFERE